MLGVPINIAMTLTPKQLKVYVKDIYRALQKIKHPDRSGDEEFSKKLNDAMERLEDEATFLMSWHEFVSNPDPFAQKWEAEVKSLRSQVSSLRSCKERVEEENLRLREQIGALESEAVVLRSRAREYLKSITDGNEQLRAQMSSGLEGKQIVCQAIHARDRWGREKEAGTVTIFAVDDNAVRLDERGREAKLGVIIGTIAREDLPKVLGEQSTAVKTFGLKAKEELASVLSTSVEVGRALVCRQSMHGDYLSIIGLIKAIEDTTLAKAKIELERLFVEAKDFRKFVERTLPGMAMGEEIASVSAEFTGLVFIEEGGERKVLVAKRGSARGYWKGGNDARAARMAGVAEPEALAVFLASIGEKTDAQARTAAIGYMKGGLKPSLKAGHQLVLMIDSLPVISGRITGFERADSNRLYDLFKGVVTVQDEGGLHHYFADSGHVKPAASIFKAESGTLKSATRRISLSDDFTFEVRIPWLENGAGVSIEFPKRTVNGRVEDILPSRDFNYRSKGFKEIVGASEGRLIDRSLLVNGRK